VNRCRVNVESLTASTEADCEFRLSALYPLRHLLEKFCLDCSTPIPKNRARRCLECGQEFIKRFRTGGRFHVRF
jgi:hypothetical protein